MKNMEELQKELTRITNTCSVGSIHWTPENNAKHMFKYKYVVQFISKNEKKVTMFGYNKIKDMLERLRKIKSYNDVWRQYD